MDEVRQSRGWGRSMANSGAQRGTGPQVSRITGRPANASSGSLVIQHHRLVCSRRSRAISSCNVARVRASRRSAVHPGQHPRIHCEGAGDADPLAHASGQLRRSLVPGRGEIDHGHVAIGAGRPFARGPVGMQLIHGEGDVLRHGEPGQEAVVLG